MSDYVFDLATKVVATDQAIWAVFPGRNRRLLDTFISEGCVFLETPGVNLHSALSYLPVLVPSPSKPKAGMIKAPTFAAVQEI